MYKGKFILPLQISRSKRIVIAPFSYSGNITRFNSNYGINKFYSKLFNSLFKCETNNTSLNKVASKNGMKMKDVNEKSNNL